SKTLAKSVDCDFKRIQFTPDLLPSDVTGLNIYNQKSGEFDFRPGPAFTNIMLADEINRATPRTQSSLLECMEEKQITVDGETRKLDAPYFVIATQNPVESSGTFPLPEAQMDRFLIRMKLGYPVVSDAKKVLDRFNDANPYNDLEAVVTKEEIIDIQNSYAKVFVSEPIKDYIVRIVDATRSLEDVSLGVSPRGMLAMMRACQAYAAINGRDHVLPDDVKRLAEPVFAHRLVLRSSYGAAEKSVELIERLMGRINAPTEEPGARLSDEKPETTEEE
ncbi:AAA family ATPase, partial [Paenibacillus sp.]